MDKGSKKRSRSISGSNGLIDSAMEPSYKRGSMSEREETQKEKRRRLHPTKRKSKRKSNGQANVVRHSDDTPPTTGSYIVSTKPSTARLDIAINPSLSGQAGEGAKRSPQTNGRRGTPAAFEDGKVRRHSVMPSSYDTTPVPQEIEHRVTTTNRGLLASLLDQEHSDPAEAARVLGAFKPRPEPLQKLPKPTTADSNAAIGSSSSLPIKPGSHTLKRKADGTLRESERSATLLSELLKEYTSRTSIPNPVTAASRKAATHVPAKLRVSKTQLVQSGQTRSQADVEGVNGESSGAIDDSFLDLKVTPAIKYTKEEDDLIVYLKEVRGLTWSEIGRQLPGRNGQTVQSRYSRALCNRPSGSTINSIKRPRPTQSEFNDPTPLSKSVLTSIASSRPSSEDSIMSGFSAPSFPIEPKPQSSGRTSTRLRGGPRPEYGLLKLTRSAHGIEKSPINNEDQPLSGSRLFRMNSAEDLEESSLQSASNLASTLMAKPLKMDFERETASIAISTSDPKHQPILANNLPYLSYEERQFLQHGLPAVEWDPLSGIRWQGAIVHVDFQQEEMEALEESILSILSPPPMRRSSSIRKRIQKLLKNIPDNKVYQISWDARRRHKLETRNRESVEAFLNDAASGLVNHRPRIERISGVTLSRQSQKNPGVSTSSMLRHRELGSNTRRGIRTATNPLSTQSKNLIFDTMGPAFSFTGASSDVTTVAWAPDGQRFAAGSACLVDDNSMQYNRPNNLLYGDVASKTLLELPDHHVIRTKAQTGVNSSHTMHISQDPRLFTTISMVNFSPDGKYLFSAGYDSFVRVWKIRPNSSMLDCVYSLKHKAPVDALSVSCKGLVATASKRTSKNAIKVLNIPKGDEAPYVVSFTSQKAIERSDLNILPTCLKFEPNFGRLLLAGFGANIKEDGRDINGEICLWDVSTEKQLQVHGSTRNVFDVAFNSRQAEAPLFAVGCVAGTNVNRGCHSIVRFYDQRVESRYGMFFELECPALDMNDVVFCPHDDAYFAAGCTDGKTYIWDIRKPENLLYTLSHGKPLMELDDFQARETLDTGIRFCSWGQNRTRLYTGSSDGVVKTWDVTRAPEDVFIKDIITLDSGVMSGAFSPDNTSLLIGEVNGSVNVLEVGREDCTVKDMEPFRFIPAPAPLDNLKTSASTETDTAIAIAADLVRTKQIEIVPFGGLPIRQATQGPNYSGPYDSSLDAPLLRQKALEFQHSLATTPDHQCAIPACNSSVSKLTSEEAGDSGRSMDRIPDELRKAWMTVPSNRTVVRGKSKCTNCGRPARPSVGGGPATGAEKEALCERCGLECFRCGDRAVVSQEMDTMWCLGCGKEWNVGVLGYDVVNRRNRGRQTDVVMKDQRHEEPEDATLGDEMNDLAEYYHSLWIDRPASPPL